jgi:hypothetical protein
LGRIKKSQVVKIDSSILSNEDLIDKKILIQEEKIKI